MTTQPFTPKPCRMCGTLYPTLDAWQALPHVGDQWADADVHGPVTRTEMRNCPCGATLAIDYEYPGEKAPLSATSREMIEWPNFWEQEKRRRAKGNKS